MTVLFSAICCLMPLKAVATETREEKLVSRLINVVYDDSNSMLLKNRLWWCYAKYSLEVFSAMMQDKDSMNVYFMSDSDSAPRLANLSGDKNQQQKNITTIHNTVTNTSGTKFASLEKAYGDLKKTNGYDEKWLMVITDGDSFTNGETSSDIDKLISDCSANNIKVVYLAIGNALVPNENTSKGIYVYKADGQVSSGDTGILSRVTQICQRIFERPALTTATSSKLVLDVPASEIIVFAQGSNVSIGDITETKKTLSSVAMSASDKDKATINPLYVNSINIDTLNASIATFTPKNKNYIAEGSYDLSISADEYVVYYKPCLDVLLELFDSKGNKVSDEYIPIGSYSLQYWLTYPNGHPKHGEMLAQNLFDVDYTLTCEVDGAVRNLTSNNVDLKEGKTTITVLAEYLNFSSSDASLKYVVEDFTINELEISLEYLQQNYCLSTLEKDNKGILVKVSQDGKPIAETEWERFTAECGIDNPDFRIVKNDDSTFTVYPQYKDGQREGTATGDISFAITVSASNDHRMTDSGTVAAAIKIYDDVSAVPLGVTIAAQTEKCDNKEFSSQNTDREVTIDWNGQYLTQEQYDALALAVEIDDSDLTAEIELNPYEEGAPTTAKIKFGLAVDPEGNYPKPEDISNKYVSEIKNFKVTAEIDRDGQISAGEASETLLINDVRSFGEIIEWLLPFIIAAAIALFLFLGYAPIIKHYLPANSRYTSGRFQTTISWYQNRKAVITSLIPFMAVRSEANITRGIENVQLKVKSQGGRKAVCTNAKELGEQGYYLNGMKPTGPKKMNLTTLNIRRAGNTIAQFIALRNH